MNSKDFTMFVSELGLHHKPDKWTWVKKNSNFLESGVREAQVKNEMLVVMSCAQYLALSRSLINICWLNNCPHEKAAGLSVLQLVRRGLLSSLAIPLGNITHRDPENLLSA